MSTRIEPECHTNSSINSSLQPSLNVLKKPVKQSWKQRYRFRRVSSKGALLVLLWVFLVNAGIGPPNIEHRTLVSIVVDSWGGKLNTFQYTNCFLPTVAWLVTAIVFGWIADSILGNYSAVKLGLIILFIAAVLHCIVVLIQTSTGSGSTSDWFMIVETVAKCLEFIGDAIAVVVTLQLGLDQMPDASSANITSFIAWFVFSSLAGIGVYEIIATIPHACVDSSRIYKETSRLVQFLLPVVFLTTALCTDFFLSPKWLAKPPALSESFTTIIRVLKFAAKHKSPVNRSAFTFWEEDIPSRIDLGKSKYGGPFTTEQVENVKTALNMLKLSAPICIVMISFYLSRYTIEYFKNVTTSNSNTLPITYCTRVALEQTLCGDTWWILLSIVVHEFTIYPFIEKWVPTTLKRIGIGSAVILVINCIYLLLSGVSFSHSDGTGVDILWIELIQSIFSAQITILLYTAILEFICAQSPHNMKGFVIGYMWCTYSISSILAAVIFSIFVPTCKQPYCVVIFSSVQTAVSLFGFLLFCFMSNRYKQRVREETTTPHIWAEEAYGKYLLSGSRN